jgi:hypothetical protein
MKNEKMEAILKKWKEDKEVIKEFEKVTGISKFNEAWNGVVDTLNNEGIMPEIFRAYEYASDRNLEHIVWMDNVYVDQKDFLESFDNAGLDSVILWLRGSDVYNLIKMFYDHGLTQITPIEFDDRETREYEVYKKLEQYGDYMPEPRMQNALLMERP